VSDLHIVPVALAGSLLLLLVGDLARPKRVHATGHLSLAGRFHSLRRQIPVPSIKGHAALRDRRGRVAFDPRGARWATNSDLHTLTLKKNALDGARIPLGLTAATKSRRRRLVAVERAQSLVVIGPTQSGKTTSLAIPAILSWDGPVLAASVKTDLLVNTVSWRSSVGDVACFDPAGSTGLSGDYWSPLHACSSWPGARRCASRIVESARSEGTSADGDFWYATAAKLLAPLLFAAAYSGLGIDDVARWVDTQEAGEVADILEETRVREAIDAARSTWLRDERQRSSVYTTAETVLEAFLDSTDPSSDQHLDISPRINRKEISAERLLSNSDTLYVCAPAHDQRRLRPVFTMLVQEVIETAFLKVARSGRALDPPLLVVLDEAANIAPLNELDGLAATCAGHGVQLVTVFQDLAQVSARYGVRASTVVNNHRAKVFFSGISDPGTLDHASHLAGDEELAVPSVTRGAGGVRSTTTSEVTRRLLPPDALRRLPAGSAVLVYGALPPARLSLRPWWQDPLLAERGGRHERPRTSSLDAECEVE
jgi:type IV secretion system protein VirD4